MQQDDIIAMDSRRVFCRLWDGSYGFVEILRPRSSVEQEQVRAKDKVVSATLTGDTTLTEEKQT